VVQAAVNGRNQVTGTLSGGPLVWRGTLNEPGNVSLTSVLVNGQPAQMLPGNAFEATTPSQLGQNDVTVQATDVRGNVRTSVYRVTVTGSGASYGYDFNGNLVSKTEGANAWSYVWDAENRLLRACLNVTPCTTANATARFAYDGLGRRVEKVAGGVTTKWAYDGDDIVKEVRGSTTTYFLHGPGVDEPLAETGGSFSLTTYYHADGLGSIVAKTNSSGTVTLTRRYDAWGNLELGATTAGYAFTGREWDPETGLYYYRARYYDPKIGRFISEDPIGFDGGDANLYAYVLGNPTRWGDPRGLEVFPNGVPVMDIDMSGGAVVVGATLALVAVEVAPLIPALLTEAAIVGSNPATQAAVTETLEGLAGGPPRTACQLGGHKSVTTWANQMRKRGWTMEMIDDAIRNGQKFRATNMVSPANTATRYVHPATGQSVVIDDITNEVLHVGGPGFHH
jgi:RHS repeat-associated protein